MNDIHNIGKTLNVYSSLSHPGLLQRFLKPFPTALQAGLTARRKDRLPNYLIIGIGYYNVHMFGSPVRQFPFINRDSSVTVPGNKLALSKETSVPMYAYVRPCCCTYALCGWPEAKQ